MNKTIDKLRAEHRNLVKLLSVLKREIDSYASGGTADFDLVNDILTYHQNFPDACHHPKEDLIYTHLQNRDPDAAKAVGDLDKEHGEMRVLVGRLALAVNNVMNDHLLPREWFADVAGEFINFMQRHMKMEEVVFFPAAERSLLAEDWEDVEAKLADLADPVFDVSVEERYESIHRSIMTA
ncbi:MAG: hemerythrin domain-containing protein [Rhodospirillales bacterium]|jgi:hemerythrin-like domain-containing protein|nr:hemerythrin domain-containing protein [Rhodospirillales bacterium]MBT4040952.1 hemerythrin domain-containing protein [Rhodospirillales bacterium]MBT4625646.1 hemerythrin domain-containing protein [Rhodospirillales bacterium]MBT5350185.1 hemerythrin domain-containing protein [Rhodospirillales bacterium]MBT5522033.1 hemerythrin domain-containing protein [Rhodospirillales bacterium]